MAGLLTGALSPTKKPEDFLASTYDPSLHEVSTNELVSNQVDSLLKKDSPLLQTARTQAGQAYNARGLLSSSMGVQAGEQAVINAALPIATADASVYNTAARENTAAKNTAGQFNAGAQNQFGLQAQGGDIQSRQIGEQGAETRATQAQGGDIQARIAELQGQIQTGLIGAQGAQARMTDAQAQAAQEELTRLQGEITGQLQSDQAAQAEELARVRGEIETGLQALRGTQATDLANIEASNRLLMQSSASASQFFTQTMESVSAILNNPNLSVEQRQAAVDHQLSLLAAGLAVIGGAGNIDLGGLVDFDAVENPPSTAPVAPPIVQGEGGVAEIQGNPGHTINVPPGILPGQTFTTPNESDPGAQTGWVLNEDGTVSMAPSASISA